MFNFLYIQAQAATTLGEEVGPLGFYEKLAGDVLSIVNVLTVVVFSLGLLLFLWGVARYIYKSNDESAQREGKRVMITGIVALFVMSSVWGIVQLAGKILGIDQGVNIHAPGIDYSLPKQSLE